MKKLVIITAIIVSACFLNNGKTFAQDKSNVVTLSVSNLALATPTVYYERVLNEKTSAKLGVFFTGAKVSTTKFSGLGLMPEYRIYPGKKGAPTGFYFAPFLKYTSFSLSESSTNSEMTLSGFGGGALIGVQTGKSFKFDFFFGPSFISYSPKFEGLATAADFGAGFADNDGLIIGIRFGTSIGFAF